MPTPAGAGPVAPMLPAGLPEQQEDWSTGAASSLAVSPSRRRHCSVLGVLAPVVLAGRRGRVPRDVLKTPSGLDVAGHVAGPGTRVGRFRNAPDAWPTWVAVGPISRGSAQVEIRPAGIQPANSAPPLWNTQRRSQWPLRGPSASTPNWSIRMNTSPTCADSTIVPSLDSASEWTRSGPAQRANSMLVRLCSYWIRKCSGTVPVDVVGRLGVIPMSAKQGQAGALHGTACRHLVPGFTVEDATEGLGRSAAPLLEEERHAR